MNKLIQPKIKNKPPIGVTGPRKDEENAVISLVANKYREPEKRRIPNVKAINAKLIKPFFALEKVDRYKIAKV